MKKVFIISLLLSFNLNAQPPYSSAPTTNDTLDFLYNWRRYLLSGDFNYDEYRNMTTLLSGLNLDDSTISSLYKSFSRNQYYLDGRIGVDDLGEFDYGAYQKAMKGYLETDFCTTSNYPVAPWEMVGPTGNQLGTANMGYVSAIYVDPTDVKKIIIGSNAGGIWRTENKGLNWVPVTDDLGFPVLGISSFAASPDNPNIIFASTGISTSFLDMLGVGLLKSINGGEIWEPVTSLNMGNSFLAINKVVFDASNSSRIYIITTHTDDKRMFKSEDGGDTWTVVETGLPYGEIKDIVTLENGRVFITFQGAGNYTEIYYTTNHGNNLTVSDWIFVNKTSVLSGYNFIGVPPAPWTSPGGGPDDFNNPATSFWTATSNGISFLPLDPGTTYGATKSFSILADPASDFTLDLVAHLPPNTTLKLYLRQTHITSGVTTYVDEVIYEINSDIMQDVNISDFAIDLAYDNYAAVKIALETDPIGYTPIIGEEFSIASYAIKTSGGDPSLFKVDAIPNCLLISTDYKINRTVTRSVDGGNTFEVRFFKSSGYASGGVGKNEVVELYNNPDKYISGGISFYQSTSGVVSSTCSSCHADARSMVTLPHPDNPSQDVIIIGHDGGITMSEDGGATWQNINGDLANSLVYSIDVHESTQRIISGYQDNGSMSVQDGNWQNLFCEGDGTTSFIHPDNEEKYIVNDPQVNHFCFGSGWPSSLSLMSSENAEDTYLGMPLESSESDPDLVYFGLDRTGENDVLPHSKVIQFNTSTPTVDPVKYDLHYATGLGTSMVNSICVSESNPNILLVSTDGVYEFCLYKLNTNLSVGDPNRILPVLSPTTFVVGTEGNTPMTTVLSNSREIRDIAISHSDGNKVWVAVDNVVVDYDNGGIPIHEKWRVLYSENGAEGNTWYDYSEGLPGLPVNVILYVDGYNDLLFVGTDAGVYYRNADMDRWECFNNGFPLAVVTDLEFDYCHKTLYASTFGRSIYQCEIPFALTGTDGNSVEIVIDQNTLWDTDQNIRQTVRVQTGNTLTVSATIEMLTDKKIIIEPGAKLIVNGGTITNACDGFWGGIEVWGTTAESQFGDTQGEVVLSNGAVIEHAEVAVALWQPGNWASTGGIVRAYNSIFRNNKKDVEFMKYSNDYNGNHYPNKGMFTDCNFYWDNDFRDNVPLAHVTLYRVDGVKFSGCTFADHRTPGDHIMTNVVGIKSIDANYRVMGRCPTGTCTGEIDDPSSGWDPTVFENLHFGIYASNATTLNTINIDRCIFLDNGYGIELVSVPSPVIIRNKFEFTDNGTHTFAEGTMYGIHAINSKMLKIEENEFTDLAPNTHTSFGVVSSDLGEVNNQIYKNGFEEITYANFAQGKNRSYADNGLYGLEFPCNSNTLNTYDHYIANTLWGYTGTGFGVKAQSGSFFQPVGSSFSSDPGLIIHNEDYKNVSTYLIKYWYHSSQNPDDYSLFTVQMTNNPSSPPNLCPSNLTFYPDGFGKLTTGDKAAYIDAFDSTDNLITSKETEYNTNILDATEIAYLLGEVANLAPNNKQTTRAILNSYSPYLTTEILFAVADNTPSDFNHPWLRDLLLANIEAVTPELIEFLGTKEYPLPAPMRQEVSNAVGTTYTQRTVLVSEISQLYADKAFYAYQLIAGIQHDTTGVETDSLRFWISAQNNVLFQEMIIDSYLQDGNIGEAKNQTDLLFSYATLAPAHLRQEIIDFVKLKRWLFGVLLIDGKITTLGATDLNFLRSMASTGSGTAKYQAQNILCFFYNECDPYYFDTGESRAPEKPIIISEEKVQPEFSIYPNPAGNWVMIELTQEMFDQLTNAQIVIMDVSGKLIHQTNLTRTTYLWETGEIENGLYLITLKSDDAVYQTGKVIINR